MKEYEVTGHVSSFLPEGKKWKLVWADEFDGTELDRTKWDYRLCICGTRHKTWNEEGVTLDGNSNAILSVYEKDGEICSPHLQTGYNFMDAEKPAANSFDGGLSWGIGPLKDGLFMKKHGYFECRCKLQKKTGWWSAFWIQSPIIGATLHPETSGMEIDIMESFVPGKVIHHALHYGGYAGDHKEIKCGCGRENLDLDAYHTFGVDWNENGYTFYIDGEEDGHVDGYSSMIPEFILLSTEVDGYRALHAPTEAAREAVGDTFIVDYVRVFDAVE